MEPIFWVLIFTPLSLMLWALLKNRGKNGYKENHVMMCKSKFCGSMRNFALNLLKLFKLRYTFKIQ